MMQRAHRGARRSLLTPALLALLLGTLGLFSAAPAQAQRRAELSGLSLSAGGSTVTLDGCVDNNGKPNYTKPCAATVPRNVLAVTVTPTWDGTPNTATVSSREMASGKELTAPQSVTSGNSVTVALASGLAYNSAGTEHRTLVAIRLERTAGLPVYYGITIYKGGPTSVSLSISPDQVTETDNEAATATVTATLSWPWDGDADVVIPLTGTHGTSEAGDWVFENANVMIRRGQSTGTTRIFVWPDADTDDETMTVGLGTLPTGARSSRARNTTLTAGTPSSATLTITDDDDGSGLSGSSGTGGSGRADKYAGLIAKMYEWRNDSRYVHDKAHTDRWDRALLAFGETVSDNTLTPMTAAEAQGYADQGWTRWVEVAKALHEIEAYAALIAKYADLIAKMYEWRNDSRYVHDKAHTDRWDRALLAFGETVSDNTLTPMTAAEAQGYADQGWTRWVEVAKALHEIEAYAALIAKYADLIAKMYEWRNDSRYVHDKAHTDRWDRALLAFGETVSDNTLTPMTAAEAQGYADQGWTRWVEVAKALHEIEAYAALIAKYADLIAKMYEWRNDSRYVHDKAHTDRWDRALLAFGETVSDNTLTPMTAAEAQGYADQGWTRWVEVAKALHEIEALDQTSGDRAPRRIIASGQALALVDGVGADEAAAALFDGRSLDAARLEALDRLGNANGRYDVGDLLAWIERCRTGGARCDGSPKTSPSAAALPAAIAAGAVPRRPRRRAPRGRVRRRRRTGMLTVLCAATLWSCDAAGGPTAAVPPEPGLLTVEWTAPARGPVAAGALVEIDGPHVGDARVAGGLELYATEGTGPKQFVLAGTMRNGAVLEFEVPDRRQAGLYSVRVVEVAGDDHRLLDADRYRAGIASN